MITSSHITSSFALNFQYGMGAIRALHMRQVHACFLLLYSKRQNQKKLKKLKARGTMPYTGA